MRTKTLLLSAVALAAGLVASQAQSNVFSANVVGYVSTPATAAQYVLMSLPLDSGSNNLTGLFPNLGNGSQILVWNGSSYVLSQKSFGNWSSNLNLTPGQGFFVKPNVTTTNTIAGSVAVLVGGSVTNSFSAGIYALVGSPIPYSDNLTGTNLNLQLANGSQILVWNPVSQSYILSQKSFGNWSSNLVINPGQGFFVKSFGNTNWVQNFNLQ